MARYAVMLLVLTAGCASSPEKAEIPPVQPPMQQQAAPVRPAATPGTIVGYSVQRRPIELHSFGAGPRPVFVMAAIHGNEPTSFDVATGLMAELRANPQLVGGVPVVIMPIANPDGLAAKTRTNSNNIDCNRNFPASNWSARRRVTHSSGGKEPASEPETNAIMQTIDRYQPRLIISVHSMEKPCNNYDGPAQAVAELMSRYNGYPATGSIGYPTPGSLGTWAGIDRQIPIITLELPRALPAAKAWPDNRQAVLAAILSVK